MTMGYGLITYSAGGQLGHYTTAVAVTATNAVAYGHHNSVGDYVVTVYDQNGMYHRTTDGGDVITINDVSVTGDTANNGKIVFYVANGNLRICDSEFDNTSSSNKLFYYISGKRFSGTVATEYVYDGYYQIELPYKAPEASMYSKEKLYPGLGGSTQLVTTNISQAVVVSSFLGSSSGFIIYGFDSSPLTYGEIVTRVSGSSTPATIETVSISPEGWFGEEKFMLFPPPGESMTVRIESTTLPNAAISTGGYLLYASFIYDGNQETGLSRLYSLEDVSPITISAGEGWSISPRFTGEYDNRITGMRLYVVGSTSESVSAPMLLLDCDFRYGVRSGRDKTYTSFNGINADAKFGSVSSTNVYYYTNDLYVASLSGETYESINGYSPDELIYPRYKTAVVNSGIAYLGNCMVDGTKYPDTIFKSYPNRLDTFTLDNRLDVVTGDGEDIVKLETFADRILEFKEQTLYIINVASEYEFVESIERGKGIAYPYNSIETDYGIAFINDYGVFLYTGERVINLLLDRDQRRWKYSLEDYQTRLTDFKYATLGYDRRSNKLLIVQDMSPGSAEKVGLEFDMVNYAWTSNDELIPDMGNMTNIVTDWNGYPISIISATSVNANLVRYVSTGYMYSSGHTVDLRTPLYTLDGYNSKKTIYKVYITYSGLNSTDIKVTYRAQDDNTYNQFVTSFLSISSSIVTQEFIPLNSSESTNKKRFSIRISKGAYGVLSPSFTVHEIKIVYRDKRGRV